MSFQSVFLIGVIVAFGSLFFLLMYAWITVNLHQMKQPTGVVQATPARRPDPEPLKRMA